MMLNNEHVHFLFENLIFLKQTAGGPKTRNGFQRCSLFAVLFDAGFVVFAASYFVRCCVRKLLWSHYIVFDFAVLFCSMFCFQAYCCVRCFVRTSSECRDSLIKMSKLCGSMASLFCSLFCSTWELNVVFAVR